MNNFFHLLAFNHPRCMFHFISYSDGSSLNDNEEMFFLFCFVSLCNPFSPLLCSRCLWLQSRKKNRHQSFFNDLQSVAMQYLHKEIRNRSFLPDTKQRNFFWFAKAKNETSSSFFFCSKSMHRSFSLLRFAKLKTKKQICCIFSCVSCVQIETKFSFFHSFSQRAKQNQLFQLARQTTPHFLLFLLSVCL